MSYKIIVTPVNVKENIVINENYISSVIDIISTIQSECDVIVEVYKDGRWQTYNKYKLNEKKNGDKN